MHVHTSTSKGSINARARTHRHAPCLHIFPERLHFRIIAQLLHIWAIQDRRSLYSLVTDVRAVKQVNTEGVPSATTQQTLEGILTRMVHAFIPNSEFPTEDD
eukprot:135430-Pelagomonas_calceolata.AAC.2